MRQRLLAVFALSTVLGIAFWHSWPLYPFKLLVVLMHESGHAAATLLVGGSVDSISVRANEGGLTWSRYAPTLLHRIVVSSAGYVGSVVSGCVLLLTAARSREAKWPLFALAGWTSLVTVLYVRDLFTLGFSLACTAVLFALGRFGAVPVRRILLGFLASFSVLYALFDIKDDLLRLGPTTGQSDADALAQATFIPAIVWGIGWGLVSLLLVFLTLRWIFRQPERPAQILAAQTNVPSGLDPVRQKP